ncbi:ribosomal protein S18-alanine N-acetyltransferase [Aerosakkonema funiforme]|uniref:Ribosomal protein S18-alanine N-acetyltransferase n=1 Tax=Aerosakkonema funiforme FACHB-1375 TaxID=2949571 RepID=A0A926ZJ58_9CYAN|nr:ribosomal protein S18-alanine N-acetyltransferase [Aerosakkonema funiforme]MBD2185228.1 ribosomal protein S18-alanine N-acetyltransferase [Aerosakkonema funiforme FACHB-1375]
MRALNFLNIKPLTAELLPAVVELDRLCFGGLWTLEGYQKELDSRNSDIIVLLEDDRSEAKPANESPDSPTFRLPPLLSQPTLLGLGCLWAILDEAHITILAVHPNYRSQGFGMVLLTALLSSAKKRSLSRVTLEVAANNEIALSLYQKFGFQIAGRRRGYYQDTGEDALILWLSGLGHPHFEQTLADCDRQVRSRLIAHGWDLSSAEIKKI